MGGALPRKPAARNGVGKAGWQKLPHQRKQRSSRKEGERQDSIGCTDQPQHSDLRSITSKDPPVTSGVQTTKKASPQRAEHTAQSSRLAALLHFLRSPERKAWPFSSMVKPSGVHG